MPLEYDVETPHPEVEMRKLLVLGLLVALSGTLLVAGPALSERRTVEVGDDYFVREGDPPTVRVKRNDKVVWDWEGRNPHNVTVTSGPTRFKSSTKTSGTYSKKMTRRGTYRIVCTIHRATMKMTLRVRR
jgi:plastocyanin